MKKRENGSITVEAALFLPLFFLAFISIYNLVYFARAQLLVQYAADQAAKEVAQYSYILERTGIIDSWDKLGEMNKQFRDDLEKVQGNLEAIQKAEENALNGQDVIQNGIEIGKSVSDTYDVVYSYVENPASFINGILGAAKEGTYTEVANYMINMVAKSCVDKQLSIAGGNADPEVYKEKLGISDLTVSKSVWCKNQTRDIRIIVDFKMTNRVPFFEMEPRHYRVCASTRVWSGV